MRPDANVVPKHTLGLTACLEWHIAAQLDSYFAQAQSRNFPNAASCGYRIFKEDVQGLLHARIDCEYPQILGRNIQH